MSSNARSTSSNLRSIGSDAVAEHDDGIVESCAHATDVGVDVGDALTDVFVDARFGGEQAVVDTILDLVDAAADDVRHLGLLARRLRRDLVDPGDQSAEADVDVVDDLCRHFVHPRLGGAGDVVEVGDHARRLVVELAQVLVERAELVLEGLLAVLDLLDDRTRRRLDGSRQADVRFVDDATDAGVHLLVPTLVQRGELGEALFEGALDLGLECRVAGAGPLDGGGEIAELVLELGASGAIGGHLRAEPLHLIGHLIAEAVEFALDGGDDGCLHIVGLHGHDRPPLVGSACSVRLSVMVRCRSVMRVLGGGPVPEVYRRQIQGS